MQIIDRLSATEEFEPEFLVGVVEMFALIATVTMHAVRIDHQFHLLAFALDLVQELKGILMMDIVVTCTMSKFEHHWLHCRR